MGAVIFLYGMTPNTKVDSVLSLRFVKLVPTIRWGYDLSVWLAEDLDPQEEQVDEIDVQVPYVDEPYDEDNIRDDDLDD